MEEERKINEKFQSVKDLDSWALIEMPKPDIITPWDYRTWLLKTETEWMRNFNEESHYFPNDDWNCEAGIGGKFGAVYYPSCKLYRQDGTANIFSPTDWRAKRGLLIRDHYSTHAVVKVQTIAENLSQFLQQQRIPHLRFHLNREKKEIIEAVRFDFH